ncbi:MAG: hypothetical protein KZQ81_14270 [Candidatus Thiodiazotropha sp. (ex Rostrolucina anterorostrata)]|nr:hypothetical protein [Candidatus Thiodiazotropha sp. (ex Rostrolucina anterorostrata)]
MFESVNFGDDYSSNLYEPETYAADTLWDEQGPAWLADPSPDAFDVSSYDDYGIGQLFDTTPDVVDESWYREFGTAAGDFLGSRAGQGLLSSGIGMLGQSLLAGSQADDQRAWAEQQAAAARAHEMLMLQMRLDASGGGGGGGGKAPGMSELTTSNLRSNEPRSSE